MPLNNPSYPPGPYRFTDREYMIIAYRTDIDALQRVVPKPLEVVEPIVKYEFIRMPDSTGFGDYTESGQVIPVQMRGEEGGYVHFMFLNDHPPVAGGRELWGFPKKLASPKLVVDRDTLVGTLDYGHVRIATGTMGFKHREFVSIRIGKRGQQDGLHHGEDGCVGPDAQGQREGCAQGEQRLFAQLPEGEAQIGQ